MMAQPSLRNWLHWTDHEFDLALNRDGVVVDGGQLTVEMARDVDRRAKAGELVKYRGYWNTLSPRHGMGNLKTIWALPEIAEVA